MSKALNLFSYSDYRSYIKVWLKESKRHKSSNLTKLAHVIQVHPTFLSQVVLGGKDLSLEQAALMCRHFEFTKLEQEYFFVLIQIDKAGSSLLQEILVTKKKEIEAEKNKLANRFKKHRQLSGEQKAIFYSSWIYMAAWASTGIQKGQTVLGVAELYGLPKSKADEVLSFLTQTGLCEEKNGIYTPGETHVHVANESPFVVKHHINWRIKAIQQMDHREPAELFFTAPMALSENDFLVLREKFNVAIQETVKVVSDSNAEKVACLNLDFFKLK